MGPALAVIGFAIGFVIAYIFIRRRPAKVYAHAELWVPVTTETIPDQAAVMNRMLQDLTYAKRGRSPISPAEGLIFSDVRLDINVVKRAKNVALFEKVGFDDAVAFVRLQYISEIPLKDKRHLQFLTFAAEAYMALTDGPGIYNVQTERFWPASDVRERLLSNPQGNSPEWWLEVQWRTEGETGFAETVGLRNLGFDELRTPLTDPDQRWLITEMVEFAAHRIWEEMKIPALVTHSAHGDAFEIQLRPKRKSVEVRIMRIQAS
jgi:hypothetical protein